MELVHVHKLSLSLLIAASVATLASPAHAGDPGEELEPSDYYRADPIPVPGEFLQETGDDEPLAASTNVMFINFDGANLSYGSDDSAANRTQIQQLAGNFSAYGNGAKRAATLQAVKQDWSPFNVVITESRPNSGNYTMCMTGPTNPFGGGVLGIAPLDCNDQQDRNVVFAFHSANDQFPASTQATTISQEIAHAYGLEHVNEEGDIMNPYNAGGDPSFLDQCIPIVPNNGQIYCTQQHIAECGGNGSTQNSYQELMTLFGPSAPDNSPPTVSITSPSDGAMYSPGATFDVTATANDDVNVARVELFNGNEMLADDTSAPYSWTLQNVPAGVYPLHAVAYDDADNSAMSAVVTIYVEDGDPTTTSGDPTTGDPTTGDPTTGNPTTGDPTTGATDSGSDSGTTGEPTTGEPPDTFDSLTEGASASAGGTGLPPDYGGEEADEGCACTTSDNSRMLLPGLLLMLLVVPRRRRQ